MNINVHYNHDSRETDLVKLAKLKAKALYNRAFIICLIAFIIACILITTGIIFGFSLLGNTFAGVGLGILLMLLWFFREIKVLGQKDQKEIGTDSMTKRNLSFTDELFIYNDEEIYYEYKWDYFSYYLSTQEFIFIIDKTFDISFFVGKEHLSEKEIEELSGFLSSKFPLWKSKPYY